MATTSHMPEPRQRYYNNNGTVAAGCLLYTYASGTSTPKATYTDYAGAVPHANPIVLDSKGEALIYWDGSYKVDLKTAAGVQITGYPVDNYVSVDTLIAASDATLRADLAAPTGDTLIGTKYAGGPAINLSKWIDGNRVSAGSQAEGIFTTLQDAIDEAHSRSKGLTISGLWTAAAQLNLYNNIDIEGHRTGDTIIKLANGLNTHLLYGSGLTSVRIANLTLDGNKANQTSGAVARCLYLVDSHQVYAERLIVKNAADHGMHVSTGPTTDPLSDVSEIWIDKCIFADNGTDFASGNGGSGIAWTGRRLWARDSYAYGNLLAGFKFTGQYVVASGLHANANLAGGFTTGFDAVTEEGLHHVYTACRATSNGNPADNTTGGDGFRHQGQVDRIIHRDCVASGNQWSGVALVASLSVNPVDFDIFGGEYKNNGTSFVPSNIVSGSGIALLSTNSSSVPTNVRIDNVTATDTQATKTQLYGVEIQQGGNITIGAGCRLEGNKTGSVFNVATTVTDVHMLPSIESADFIVRSRAAASVTGTTSATDLYTITIPANTFNPGQRFRIRSRGSVSGTNGTKQIRLWVGAGAALIISQSAGETQEWFIDAYLEVAGTASTKTAVTGVEIGGTTTSLIISDSTALSAAITIKVAVTLGSASDTVSGASFYVEPIY